MKKILFIFSLIVLGAISGVLTSTSLSRLTQDIITLALLKTNLPCSSQGARASLTGAYIENLSCIVPILGNVKAEAIHIRPTLSREIKASGTLSSGSFTSILPLNKESNPGISLNNIDLSQFDALKSNFALSRGTLSLTLDRKFVLKDMQFQDLSKKFPLPESLSSISISSLEGSVSSMHLPALIQGTFETPEGGGEFQAEMGELTCKGSVRFTLNDQGVDKYGLVMKLLNQRANIKKNSPISLNFSGKYNSPQLSLISD